MVRVLTVDDIKSLIRKVTLETLFKRLIEKLEENFSHWEDFKKVPCWITESTAGTTKLMPFLGKDYYAVKYVNTHPTNTEHHKLTVVGVGLLADVTTGYPVLISEMTLLTALRTAATSALAAKFLAKPKANNITIIGTGVQSEFQILAHHTLFDLKRVYYFDHDKSAMNKFEKNLSRYSFELIRCDSIDVAVKQADIVTTATAGKNKSVLDPKWITPGTMINAVDSHIPALPTAKIVIDFKESDADNYAELWEIISGKKKGRADSQEIFLFKSIGGALTDYTLLKLIYSLAEDFHVGHMLDLVPEIKDPKNLFGELHL